MQTTITRQTTFDAGHRLLHHGGKCQNVHGHTYRVEATVRGKVKDATGEADEGMVLDFSTVKAVLMDVVERYDHAFMVDPRDEAMVAFLKDAGSRYVVMDFPPTAENLAAEILRKMQEKLKDLEVIRVRLWETANNFAEVTS